MVKILAKNSSLNFQALKFAVVLLTCGWTQCGSGSDTPAEYRELFHLPQDQQEERFAQFSLEKQVDIYTYAMYVEPPLTRYATYLAKNGKKVLPYLLRRLEAEKSDTAKAHLIYAFKEIHERHYSLKNEHDTVESLRRVIAAMKDEYRRRQCVEYLKIIEDRPGFDS
jgi:hypothetical protein